VFGSRSSLRAVALAAGAICLIATAVLRTVQRAAFDSSAFADRAALSLSDERVAALVAHRLTDAVIEQRPDLTAIRPLLLATATGVVSSRPFRSALRAAAYRAHEAAFSEGSRRVALSVPDVAILLRGALEHGSPDLAAKIPTGLEGFLDADAGPWTTALIDLWRLGGQLRFAAKSLFLVGTALLLAAVLLAGDRRRGLISSGVALLNAALVIAALFVFGRLIVPHLAEEEMVRGALAAIWSSYLGGLLDWSMRLGAVGLVMTAGGASLLEDIEPAALLAAAVRRLGTPPQARFPRLAWASGFLFAGWLAIRFPGAVASGVAVIGGLTLAFVGLREIFRFVLESVPPPSSTARIATPWRAVAITSAGIATVAVLLLLARFGRPRAPLVEADVCNGDPTLCSRSVAQVVFPGTHNSMSNTAVADWMFPQQQAGIADQLRDGVRALLIDVHYGFPGAARIKTDLSGPRPTTEALERAVGREGMEAAIRIRDQLVGADEGRRELFLCHGFCELGASELVPVLADIRSFLASHPREVVLMVIEDYVLPEDLAAAFRKSGLADFVYRGSAPPWPTLEELAESRTGLIVFLESGRPGVEWLRPAFENIQETPYSFHRPDEFTCRPNRGGTTGSLFQVNHWIETTPAPRPSNAEVVNSRAVLLPRLERCMLERRLLPNIVAVDFYRSGDLLEVAAELNRRGLDQLTKLPALRTPSGEPRSFADASSGPDAKSPPATER
jgi:hypothetical protein